MVYGLNIVPEHGYYVNVEMADGNPAAIRTIDQSDDGGVSLRSVYGGRLCHTDHFPTKMRWLDRNGHPVPDFNRAELLNVSERAKNLIDQFEPGVHQFIAVDYTDGKDNFLEKRYFWVICNRIDSIDRDHTTFILRKGKMWRPIRDIAEDEPELLPEGVDPKAPSKFVFSLSQIGNAHAWQDKHMDVGGPWLSHEFGDALKASGLTGVKLSDAGMEAV